MIHKTNQKKGSNSYVFTTLICVVTGLCMSGNLFIINNKSIDIPKEKISISVSNLRLDLGPGSYRAVSVPCCINEDIVAFGGTCYPWGQTTCVENSCPEPSYPCSM